MVVCSGQCGSANVVRQRGVRAAPGGMRVERGVVVVAALRNAVRRQVGLPIYSSYCFLRPCAQVPHHGMCSGARRRYNGVANGG